MPHPLQQQATTRGWLGNDFTGNKIRPTIIKKTGTPSDSVHAEPKKTCEPPTLETRFSKGPKH